MQTPTHEEAIASTRLWLEKAVIGLNLCPLPNRSTSRTRFALLSATPPSRHNWQKNWRASCVAGETSPEETDTTLLIHPYVLQRFLDFNEFQDIADAIVAELELDGVCR
jgi:hypothetical protein